MGPVWVSNLDITDAYRRGTLRSSQVVAFAYDIPLAADDDCIVVCIDLVLPMGWVDSANFSVHSQKQ